MLSGPWKQLEETNAEIDRLEQLIQGVKEKRTEIEKYINRYSCILAPIHRVSPNILHTIFAHCLPTHRNPTMGASESPMLLTRVCSIWRSVAFAAPRLWAQLHIPFRPEGKVHSGYDGHPPIPSERVMDILQLRCRATKEWLSRSGDCPLSISISFSTMYAYNVSGVDRPDKSTILLLETILLFSSRWRILELASPFEAYCELENMLSGHTLIKLVQLGVSINPFPGSLFIQPSLRLLTSPNLQRTSVSLPPNSSTQLFALTLVPWHNITHLAKNSLCNIQNFITLLQYCPQLVHGDFVLMLDEISARHEIVTLPCLTSLWISLWEVSPSFSGTSNPYNPIHAPKLRWIEYKAHVSHDNTTSAFSFFPLIEKAIDLRRLSVDRFCLTPENVLKILHMPSTDSLTILVLDSTSPGIGERCSDPFDLNVLIVKDNPGYIATKKVLLPRLEVFELHTTRALDDTVMRFITSRMNLFSPCAVRRKVKVVFDRPQEEGGLDITEEVRKRAVEIGVGIELDLQYPTPLVDEKYYVDTLSPSFIRSDYIRKGAGGLTWEHREPEDEEYWD